MAEKKKIINVRLVKGKGKRKARAKPKEKSKTKQKQKQRQTVNVQVSSGGSGGGGTSFIPMPQAPAFDYSLLASLIRPANTVDMPIRAMSAIPEPVQTREAEAQTIAESRVPSGPPISKGGFPVPTGFPSRSKQAMSESSGVESGFITSDTERVVKAPRADKGKSRGSYKEKQINIGRNVQNLFALGASTSGFASGGEDEPPRFQAMTGGGRFGEK